MKGDGGSFVHYDNDGSEPVYNAFGRKQGTYGKWQDPDVPGVGWSWDDWQDLGEQNALCTMCEHVEHRYEFTMRHPGYPDVLYVGKYCAGWMLGDVDLGPAIEQWALSELGKWQTKCRKVEEARAAYKKKMNDVYLTAQERVARERKELPWEQRTNGNWASYARYYDLLIYKERNGTRWGYRIQRMGVKEWSKVLYPTVKAAATACKQAFIPDPEPLESDVEVAKRFPMPEKPMFNQKTWGDFAKNNPDRVAEMKAQSLRRRRKKNIPDNPVRHFLRDLIKDDDH
jgi:hypothetical protein